MQDLLQLLVEIRTRGLDSLEKVQGTLKNVTTEASGGSEEFQKFEKVLGRFTESGLTLKEALQQVAGMSRTAGGAMRQMAIDALAADKEFAVFQNNAQKIADKQAAQAEKAAAQAEKIAQRQAQIHTRSIAQSEARAAREVQLANNRAQAEEAATERIIRTLERRAAASAAADRVQRLEQERGYALSGVSNPAQASRINAAYDTRVESELAAQEARAAQRAKVLGERAALREQRAAESEMNALGRFGTMGAAYGGGLPMFAGRGAFTAGLALPLVGLAAGALAYGTVRSAAQESRETVNSASRLDLSVSQTRDLQNESRLAGVNFGSLENASRSLSAALEDGTGSGKKAADTLSKLGINTVTSTGQIREMGPVLLDVIDKLSDLPSKTERAAEGNRLLGRGYKEVEPLIEAHRALQQELSKYGLLIDENLISKLSEADTKFNALGIAFDNFKAKVAGGLEPIVIPLIVSLTDPLGFIRGTGPYPSGGPGQGSLGAFFDNLTGESRGAARGFAETPSNTPSNSARDTILNFNSSQIAAQNAGARDKFGRFMGAQGDAEETLRRQTNTAKEDYLKELEVGGRLEKSSGVNSEAYEKETAKIQGLKTAYEGLNASLKALEERKTDPKAVREYIKRLNEKDEDPGTRLVGAYDDFLANHPSLTPALRGELSRGTLDAGNSLFGDMRDKLADEQMRTDNNFTRAGGQYDRNSARLWNVDELRGLARNAKDIVERVEKGDKTSEAVSRINLQSDRDQTEAQSSRVLRNIDLNAGPGTGGQKRAADQAYAYRVQQAAEFQQRELNNISASTNKIEERARIEADYKKLLWQAEDEHETKLLEIQHKRQEEAQQLAGKIFDSLQKPGGFSQLIKSELNGTARQVFENVTSPILNSVGKSISGSAPSGGQWSTIFKGTILDGGSGKDTPVIAAQDRTTAAVDLVRQTIESAATGNPLPGNGKSPVSAGGGGAVVPGVSGGSAAASTPGGSPSALSNLTAFLGLGGLAAASINQIVNPPGFPGKKEIDTPGGITNPTTVSHNYQDSAHTGAASRIFAGSIGLTGSIIGAAGRLSNMNRPTYVDASGNIVSGSGEGGVEGNSLPSGGSGDYGDETSGSGSGESSYEGNRYPTYGSSGDFGGEVTPGGSGAGSIASSPASGNVAASASTANSPSISSGLLAAFGGGAKGGASITNFTGNLADAIANGGPKSVAAAAGSGLAVGGALVTGVLTAVQQFKSGGASGALGGVGAILGTAAAVDPEPISKAVLGAAALVTGIVKAFLPDQKALRAQQESEALTQNAYLAPPTINSTQSVSGNVLSYDKYGMPVSQGAFGSFGISQSYQVKDPYTGNYQTVPGSVVTNISPNSATPSAAALANSNALGGGSQINMTVHALDSQSIVDRSADIGAAVYKEISSGGALTQRISSVVLGS